MYRGLDVAHYVVSYALKNHSPITHLHLQKTLYYLEAVYLYRNDNGELINDSIEKWKLGPVIPKVYHEYKGYGARLINFIPSETIINFETFKIEIKKFNESTISSEVRNFLDPLIETLLIYNEYDLVRRTHEHDLWKKDEQKINAGTKGLSYDKEEMRAFFRANSRFLWELKLINA